MRKSIFKILCMGLVIIGITACGTNDTKEGNLGVFPSRIEQIDQGGVIPKGHEAKVEAESEYIKEMLWGTWVLKEIPEEAVVIDIGTGTTEESFEISVFPNSMSFGPAWAGIDSGYGLSYFGYGRGLAVRNFEAERKNSTLYFGHKASSWELEIAEEPLGVALEEYGYGVGGAVFHAIENPNDPISILNADAYNERKIAYAINQEIFSIGITDATLYEHLNETDIFEIDYQMSLIGCELQLTYGDQTVVYVPEIMLENEFSTDLAGMYMENAGVVDGYEEIDFIKGITLIPEGKEVYDYNNTQYYSKDRMMFNVHEGFMDTEFEFKEDGKLTIHSPKGDMLEYDYIYSGDALTLTRDDKVSIYSIYNYVLESQNETPTHTFYVGENEMRLTSGKNVAYLLESGLKTNVDINQPISSCQITDEIVFTYQGAELKIKAVNPYNKPIALGECTICYYSLEDLTGVIQKGDGSEIGRTTYEEIDMMYAPYEVTDNLLRYKGTTSGIIMGGFDHLSMFSAFDGFRKLLEYSNLEVVYEFENDILTKISIEDPGLLYHGLQDNVDRSLLIEMEPEEFVGVMRVRNTILDTLKSAFADVKIQVDINVATGEILMDNDILFGVDEYELSAAGKQYIDSFMGGYAAVITAEEFSDCISEVLFEGHTDSTGSYAYNLTLSQKRAESVLNYCMSSTLNGLDVTQKEKLQELSTAIGYSSSDPILTENGDEDKDASRRVAIKFYVNVDADIPENIDVEYDIPNQNAEISTDVSVEVTQQETVNDTKNEAEKSSSQNGTTELENFIASLDNTSILLMQDSEEKPVKYTFPTTVLSLVLDFWNMSIEDSTELVEPGVSGVMLVSGDSSVYAIILNETEKEMSIYDCKVIGVMITEDMNSYMALKGDITVNSNFDEIKANLGAPDDMFEEDGYKFITYSENRTIHFLKGEQNGIFFMAPEYSYGEENFFYDAFNTIE